MNKEFSKLKLNFLFPAEEIGEKQYLLKKKKVRLLFLLQGRMGGKFNNLLKLRYGGEAAIKRRSFDKKKNN